MKKYLRVLLSIGLAAVILNGCRGILTGDNPAEELPETGQGGAEIGLPEIVEPSNGENEISNTEDNDNSSSLYGTWEVKDYQSAEVSALSLDDMENFRGITITYQSDSIVLDDVKVTDGNFTYETKDITYNYDSLIENYKANLGEWWNNISEVTCVTIDSNESFFGNQFFVADSETIWIYYEGVFFLAKKVDG